MEPGNEGLHIIKEDKLKNKIEKSAVAPFFHNINRYRKFAEHLKILVFREFREEIRLFRAMYAITNNFMNK